MFTLCVQSTPRIIGPGFNDRVVVDFMVNVNLPMQHFWSHWVTRQILWLDFVACGFCSVGSQSRFLICGDQNQTGQIRPQNPTTKFSQWMWTRSVHVNIDDMDTPIATS